MGHVNIHVNLRHMHILRYVTGLGGVGHVNIHVNLRHMHILRCVTGLALDELQDEKSYGGHRSSLDRQCGNVSWKKRPGEFSGTNSL